MTRIYVQRIPATRTATFEDAGDVELRPHNSMDDWAVLKAEGAMVCLSRNDRRVLVDMLEAFDDDVDAIVHEKEAAE